MSHSGAFLYDAPGPRARRRILLGSVVSALVLAGVFALALVQFGRTGQLDADRWTPFLDWPIWSYLLVGLRGTALAAALVAVLAGAFGLLLAVGRLSQNRPLRWLSTGYIEVARTIPVLLLIYLMLFGLPAYGINLPVLWKLVVPLTIANAAVVAEIVRAGVLALPRGQTEAALSLGIRRGQAMRFVVLPQALRHVTPSLVTQLVSLIKDTSLGYVVAFTELLYRAQVLSAYNRLLIQTFLVVALIYLVFNGALSYLAARLRTRVRRQVAPPAGPAEEAADRELETPVVR
ncbi:amino acid ABC transporter permease [Modestobacter sp. VKM Ac-2978]|uniref:amino acid ABC transporter permease n=1 Tax=Modestobacter sp. VKM Ac-2978 TaxID=3004132 RepID=UPI0022AAD345|nr:amino acid ABC transporter permease [Modestobacter sp. VKM Ac-2978]MCZ2849165.1 amino acid ABC transporter permease [Modestobacter sp. VKM Ac-2978]